MNCSIIVGARALCLVCVDDILQVFCVHNARSATICKILKYTFVGTRFVGEDNLSQHIIPLITSNLHAACVSRRRRESIFLPLSSPCSRFTRDDISGRVEATQGEKKKFRTPTPATLPQLMRANVVN